MTLSRIKVKDFQSIAEGEVELGSLTVFTGPSSVGKSAFLRGAEAVVRNSFTPSQVRQGAKEAKVTVELDEHIVEAQRGKSKSTYILDGYEYTKAGRTVPEPVAEVFSMDLVADMDPSFSTQFDKPFLIADPGATAAKVLGTLTNVSVLHSGMKEANRRVLEARSKLKVKQTDLEQAETNIERFSDLDSNLKRLAVAEKTSARADQLEESIASLSRLISTLTRLKEELRDNQKSKKDVSSQVAKLLHVESLAAQLTKVDGLLDRIETSEASLPTWRFQDVPSDTDSLTTLLSRVVGISDAIQNVETVAARYKTTVTMKKKAQAEAQESEAEYDKLLREMGQCPLCGNQLTGGHLD